MPVTCTASSLASEAACFTGLSPDQQEAIKIYLLATIAGASTNPNTLATLAACFTGFTAEQQEAIQTYLLCQVANA